MDNILAPSFRYRWVILGVCWLAYVVAFMQRLSIGPLAPFLKEDLGLTSAQVGFLVSAAGFGYMLTLVPAGWLVDRIGARWLLLTGEVFGGIFVASMFMVTTLTQGLVLMVLAGMGMGCLMPSTTKAILDWFPVKERATAMGVKQTAVNMGGDYNCCHSAYCGTCFKLALRLFGHRLYSNNYRGCIIYTV
ncbi:MFS transporter [Chloroflexota bacterium]